MKALKAFILLIIIFSLTGCLYSSPDKEFSAPGLLVIGSAVEKREIQTFSSEEKDFVQIDIDDGKVVLKPWDNDTIKVVSKMRLKAPSSKKKLQKAIDEYKLSVADNKYNLKINTVKPGKELFLAHFSVELEIYFPDKSYSINTVVKNGVIDVKGFNKLSILDTALDTGNISINDCKMYKYTVKAGRCNILAGNITGKATMKLSKGNALIENIQGDLDYNSEEGTTKISNMSGLLSCVISSGTIDIGNSDLKTSSSLYATNGVIKAFSNKLDPKGTYDFMVANGNVFVSLPQADGFDIKAKTEKGILESDFKLADQTQGKANKKNELDGIIGNGGPNIKIYVDKGNISLNQE